MTFLNIFFSIVLSLSCKWDSRTADTPSKQASHRLGVSSTKKECCLGSHLRHINTCGMKNNNKILTSCGLSRKNNNKRGTSFHECSQGYVLIFFCFSKPILLTSSKSHVRSHKNVLNVLLCHILPQWWSVFHLSLLYLLSILLWEWWTFNGVHFSLPSSRQQTAVFHSLGENMERDREEK